MSPIVAFWNVGDCGSSASSVAVLKGLAIFFATEVEDGWNVFPRSTRGLASILKAAILRAIIATIRTSMSTSTASHFSTVKNMKICSKAG